MRVLVVTGLYACAVVAWTVRERWSAMDAGVTLHPHPLEQAMPADPVRASEATGMPLRVADTRLGRVRRAGNDSRHLLYFGSSPARAVSVFATGRRFDGIRPADGWRPEDIGSGELVYVREIDRYRVAVAWTHVDRRCVAIGDRSASEMLQWVAAALAARRE